MAKKSPTNNPRVWLLSTICICKVKDMADLIDQPAIGIEEIAVFGALHPVEADLRLVTRVGAEHALEKAAVELELASL